MTLSPAATRRLVRLLQLVPALFFALVLLAFGLLSERFLSAQNFLNILVQAAHLAVLAVGMTFVLLVAGVDLSVGATMYLAGVLIGLYLPSLPAPLCLAAAVLLGFALGAVNGFFVVVLRVAPFIATLATAFVGRGIGLYLSDTKMVFMSPAIAAFARARVLVLPVPVLVAALAIAAAWMLLRALPFGRAVLAIGADREGARRAGLPVERTVFACYCLCGAFAAAGGFISLSQVAAASATFGERKEFLAIAASVLGGVSLFGGRGGVAGPIVGAVLIQTVENGLVMTDTDPYVYPLITAAIIFFAVLLDSLRTRALARLERRRIRVEEAAPAPA